MPMIRMMLAAMLNATAAVEVRIWWTLVADRWWRIVVCMRLLVRHCIASRLGLHRWKICHRIEIFAMRLVFVASFAMCVRLRSGRPSDWMQKGTWNIVVMWRRETTKILPWFVRVYGSGVACTTFTVCLRKLFIYFRYVILIFAQLVAAADKGLIVTRRTDNLKHRLDHLLITWLIQDRQLIRDRQYGIVCCEQKFMIIYVYNHKMNVISTYPKSTPSWTGLQHLRYCICLSVWSVSSIFPTFLRGCRPVALHAADRFQIASMSGSAPSAFGCSWWVCCRRLSSHTY